jgi:hypothetical protein
MRAAIFRGRARKIPEPDVRGPQVHMQIREPRSSQAARAFGIAGCVRLLECVFRLAQLGRARSFTQIELAGLLQFARELEQGMTGRIRGRRRRSR